MGTGWSARVVDAPADCAAGIQAVLDGIVLEMSHWRGDSALGRFNDTPPGTWLPLPAALSRVLAAAAEVAGESDGAFDPAMGLLADLWGFGPSGPRDAPPSPAAIDTALARSGLAWIEHDRLLLRARRTAPARLDLSGIAKGYAVDAVAEHLLARGMADFLVEIGGELRGAGIRPDGQPWWVDVAAVPGLPLAPLRVALHGISVATSGDYVRVLEKDGRRYPHTLDPRTGWPVANGVASVTVLHPHCMLADAWATALTVLGPAGMAIAERLGLAVHMALRGESPCERLSPALRAMLD